MVKEGSEAKKEEYPQEFKDDGVAALFLVTLKYKKLDKNTAKIVKDIKDRETKLNILHAENKQETLNALQVLPIDDYKPPAIPPVASLSGLIKFCSMPFEKQLTETDVDGGQSRLSMNKFHVEKYFLPFLKEEEKLCEGIPVTTYDSDGNEYPMKFKLWSNKIHVLTTVEWKRFCHDHGLKALQDFVTVWMFRHVETEQLCFVITSRRLDVFKPIKKRRRSN